MLTILPLPAKMYNMEKVNIMFQKIKFYETYMKDLHNKVIYKVNGINKICYVGVFIWRTEGNNTEMNKNWKKNIILFLVSQAISLFG